MRYYTKEWYELMQRQNYTTGMKRIPDRDYTDGEIKELYRKKRKQFIARERRSHNAPPVRWTTGDYPGAGLFDGVTLDGEDLQYIAELIDAEAPPKSAEEFSEYLDSQYERDLSRWESREPFDAERSGEVFDRMVRGRRRYMPHSYPAWVLEEADMRLLAMDLMPESVYKRLHLEELKNRAAWRKIERRAERTLSAQREKLPKEITDGFRFHDAEVLKLQRRGRDYEMLLNVEGAGGSSPYMRVTFAGVTSVERERGLRLRVKRSENGELTSNCWYMYDELYAVPEGVEADMLLNSGSLRYLTVRCGDIRFEALEQAPEE